MAVEFVTGWRKSTLLIRLNCIYTKDRPVGIVMRCRCKSRRCPGALIIHIVNEITAIKAHKHAEDIGKDEKIKVLNGLEERP